MSIFLEELGVVLKEGVSLVEREAGVVAREAEGALAGAAESAESRVAREVRAVESEARRLRSGRLGRSRSSRRGGIEIHLDRLDLDLGALLKSDEVRGALREAAESIAGDVMVTVETTPGVEVKVQDWTSDRAVVQVALDGYAGVAIETKYAPLRTAASAAGLDVS